MAAIEPGVMTIDDVISGDAFDIPFDIADIDLTGKTLQCDFTFNYRTTPILIFKESDGSLAKIVKSDILTTVRLYKSDLAMDVVPGVYQIKLYAHTSLPDTITVMVGTISIIN